MKSASVYRDLDMAFLPHPVTGDLVMKSDVKAVIQSVRNLLYTSVGEILMQPHIGGDVYKLLFELNTNMLRIKLFDNIKQTINLYEPRVELKNLSVDTIADGHGVNVTITFFILNQPTPVTETFVLKRTR